MKFEDAVRHLESLGLAAVMPDGKLHRISKSLREPRGAIPVRVLRKGTLTKGLRKMIRQSRVEARNSHPPRKHD